MYHSTLGLRVIKKKKKDVAHIRQSRPDSGLGFQVKVRKTFQVVPYSLGSESLSVRERESGWANEGVSE